MVCWVVGVPWAVATSHFGLAALLLVLPVALSLLWRRDFPVALLGCLLLPVIAPTYLLPSPLPRCCGCRTVPPGSSAATHAQAAAARAADHGSALTPAGWLAVGAEEDLLLTEVVTLDHGPATAATFSGASVHPRPVADAESFLSA